MRRPRRLRPGELWDVTIRCIRSEFRFLPTKQRREIIGFWLAKANALFPGIRIFAVVQMSNHLHLVVQDQDSQLSVFMQYFMSRTAKSINGLDRTHGPLFDRRFAAIPILDPLALVQRIAYAITNPVSARLVRTHRAWTGLCRWSRSKQPASETFTFFHSLRHQKAVRRRGPDAAIKREDFIESIPLLLARYEGATEDQIDQAITEREASLGKTGSLGIVAILKARPFDRPKDSKRSSMPLCLSSSSEDRRSFIDGWCDFVQAFRRASKEFRAGLLSALFPSYSFRPSSPLA